MTLQLQSLSLGASQHLQVSCAFLVHPPSSWLRALLANYHQTNPACTPGSSITVSPSLSHHGNTIEFA
jgi:hypothetical protein